MDHFASFADTSWTPSQNCRLLHKGQCCTNVLSRIYGTLCVPLEIFRWTIGPRWGSLF